MSAIGASVARADGPAKVRGETIYTFDYDEPGSIRGALLRSPSAAGRIVRLDPSKANAMPGVRAVITAADVPNTLAGWSMRDTPLFARDAVRYVGEPIAAVAADTLDQARAAIDAIELEIEETKALCDIQSAIAPDAPLIHPDWQSYEPAMGADFPRKGNIAAECIADPGDIDAEFERAQIVVEDEFVSQRQYQAFLEPKSALGIYRDGRYIAHTGHQFPFNLRTRMAQFFDVLPSNVRVIGHPIGGAFGGKLDYSLEPFAAALSKVAGGRPVKMVNSRSDDLTTSNSRENTIVRMRSALDAEGNILARDVVAYLDNGAYTGEMAYLTPFPFHCGAMNYRVGKLRAVGQLVYTNTPPTGAMRGVSGVAMYAALENHMDHIARTLGVDRREYRLRHLFRAGDSLPNGQVLGDAAIFKEGFDAIEKLAPWAQVSKQKQPYRGVGLVAGIWLVNPLPGAATVKIEEDGTVGVITAATDNGTGSLATGIPQIVAEVLGVRPDQVRVSDPDTDLSGFDAGSQGGRTTQVVGNAARMAAEEVRGKLFETAAQLLQAEPDTLELTEGMVRVAGKPATGMTLSEVATAATFDSGPIQGTGRALIAPVPYNPNCASGLLFPFFTTPTYHVHFAEVEVDPVTGNVKVLRYLVAQEVGRAINPKAVAGQIQGGVAQGIGFALYESLRYGETGEAIEKTLLAYRLPLAVDIPRVEFVMMEHENKDGPFGAKGAGEASILLPPAAIASAVSDAIGKPIRKIPITPEDVLAALQED
jgi:CO/xanthine dehydrogenase Mo-binding subunit